MRGKAKMMSSTTTYRRGRVVVVEVPFSDLSATKRRPALIVSSEVHHRRLPDIIVCPISSRSRYFDRPGPGDQPLRQWKNAGLHYPSTARASKVIAVDKRIVGRTLGKVSDDDLRRVEDTLRKVFAL
jgi:mRNA interferase MazF